VDSQLVDYLNSGATWLLVGSGPSNEMGYPTWRALASSAVDAIRAEAGDEACATAKRHADASELPEAFDALASVAGMERLVELLRAELVPRRATGSMYEQITRWPIPVYLTTNYDDEIQSHLARLGLAFRTLTNSPDHFGLVTRDLDGAIVKIHRDLTTLDGLVLTQAHYGRLAHTTAGEYWRTRLGAVFAMNRVVILGYSLTDPHMRAVLSAAKSGTSAHQPVIWVAPNVTTRQARDWLENYRIKVIAYPSVDGDHSGLKSLVKSISQFVIPRESVQIRRDMAEVLEANAGGEPAATAVYVFNQLAPYVDLERLRVEVALAAVESIGPRLRSEQPFSVDRALEMLGWPASIPVTDGFRQELHRRAIKSKLFVDAGDGLLAVGDDSKFAARRTSFESLRDRFLQSVQLRVQRADPSLSPETAERIAAAVNESLTGFFQRGGLTLATLIFGTGRPAVGRCQRRSSAS
jgi:hypothetical protein